MSSIAMAVAFQQLRQKVDMLALEQAEQARRLATLEAAECATCVQRRAADAERQRRLRHRHVTELSGQIKITG